MSPTARAIVEPARVTLGYADRILTDVGPDRFARMPDGVRTNHPAWVIGHLGLYPDAVLKLIGRDDLARPAPDEYTELFKGGSECRDDPSGEIYPPMNDIIERFRTRSEVVLGAVAEADDETFTAPTPSDHGLADLIPSVGGVANFMLGAHSMMHLGQISAWRRAMGLGPCM